MYLVLKFIKIRSLITTRRDRCLKFYPVCEFLTTLKNMSYRFAKSWHTAALHHFTIRRGVGGNEEARLGRKCVWACWSLVYGGRIRPAVPRHFQKSTVYLITGNERACKWAGIETRGKLRSHLIGLCIGPAFVSRTCKGIVNDWSILADARTYGNIGCTGSVFLPDICSALPV